MDLEMKPENRKRAGNGPVGFGNGLETAYNIRWK